MYYFALGENPNSSPASLENLLKFKKEAMDCILPARDNLIKKGVMVKHGERIVWLVV